MEKKLPKISRVDQVYSALVNSIVKREWEPGDRIPAEAEIAEMYGVNKLTVRMALQKLNVVGILETRVGEGSFVKKFNLADYFTEINDINLLSNTQEEIAEFRSVLQVGSVLLAQKLPKQELAERLEQLEDICQKMAECLEQDDIEGFQTLDQQFHSMICKLSNNKMMVTIAQATEQLIREYTEKSALRSIKAGRKKELLDFHRFIVDSLKKGDISAFIDQEYRSIQH